MWIAVIVFLACFTVVVLVGLALFASKSRELKQTASRLQALSAPQSAEAVAEGSVSVRLEEKFSSLPWLDNLLRKANLAGRLRLLLYQADVQWTVGRLLLSSMLLALAAGSLVYLRTAASVPGGLAAACAGAAPFLYMLRRRQNRFEQMRQFLPEALDLMVSAIRAGHSFSSAMGMASKESPEPVRRELRQCYDEQNYGLELRAALSNLQYRMPLGEVRMIVTAVLIQSESGGNLTEILDKVAYLIRENFRLRRQVRVHTAQGRMSGWVLITLPPVLGFLIYLLSPAQMSLLWTHPTGRKLVYTGLVMNAIGGLAIRKIVRIRI
jgi:tight adherence protein B